MSDYGSTDLDVLGLGNYNSNVSVGPFALHASPLNQDSTATGANCLRLCVQPESTGTGSGCLQRLTTAKGCCAMGYLALSEVTSRLVSDDCTAFGHMCATRTQASSNTAVGSSTLFNNCDGEGNTAMGGYSQFSHVNGSRNASLGWYALMGVLEGNDNTASGWYAASAVGSFSEICAYGSECLRNNIGPRNTAMGTRAMRMNQMGENSCAFGFEALESSHSARNSCAFGCYTMRGAWGSDNTGVGAHVMSKWTSTGSENSAVGSYALHACRGSRNTANGVRSLFSLDNGHHNTSSGYTNLLNCIEGVKNTGLGACGGLGVVRGSSNTFIGHNAGPKVDVSDTVCLGAYAQSTRDGELVIASSAHPINTTKRVGEAGLADALPPRPCKYIQVTLNGESVLIPVYSAITTDNDLPD